MRVKAVIFDFDGTVADTAEGIFESAQYAMKVLGKEPIELVNLRKFIGPPLLYSFKNYAGLDDSDAEKAVELYRENYSAGGLYKLRFYDGMLELLDKLRNENILTGVASAKPDVFIQRILEHYSIRDKFDYAQGVSLEDYCTDKTGVIHRVMTKLGISDPQECLMVGDTLFDIEGAKSLHTKSAAVLYGYGNNTDLIESGADLVVENLKELAKNIL